MASLSEHARAAQEASASTPKRSISLGAHYSHENKASGLGPERVACDVCKQGKKFRFWQVARDLQSAVARLLYMNSGGSSGSEASTSQSIEESDEAEERTRENEILGAPRLT